MSIVPALAAGGVITVALLQRGLDELLPGMWCATYALGLFASRAMVPKSVVYVAVAFGAGAALLLLGARENALAWWIMPLAFRRRTNRDRRYRPGRRFRRQYL